MGERLGRPVAVVDETHQAHDTVSVVIGTPSSFPPRGRGERQGRLDLPPWLGEEGFDLRIPPDGASIRRRAQAARHCLRGR